MTKIKKSKTKIEDFDLDKLAYAVAMAETQNCKKWFGKMYNNCFGIKNWNTVPCEKTGRLRMCIFYSPEESYKAFKIIWAKHYKRFPDYRLASIWTGRDSASTWLKHVRSYYFN